MIDKIIENWKKAQESGAWLPCPKCGLMRMDEVLHHNSLSRRCDLYICDACSVEEDLEDSPICPQHQPVPVGDWFVTNSVYSQSGAKHLDNGNFKIRVEHEILLTQEDIDDIMVGALEGGINYWCQEAEVIKEKRVADWGHEQIARGGSLILHDIEDYDDTQELTLEKFLNGFKLWVAQGGDHYGAISHGRVDCCQIDAECADAIVQYAVFGQLVFG